MYTGHLLLQYNKRGNQVRWIKIAVCFVAAERLQAGAGELASRWTTRPSSVQT